MLRILRNINTGIGLLDAMALPSVDATTGEQFPPYYVFNNEEQDNLKNNSKFCEEFKGDLKRLRRKFSQDDLY